MAQLAAVARWSMVIGLPSKLDSARGVEHLGLRASHIDETIRAGSIIGNSFAW
jgi:hypothetical protein